MTNEQNSRRHHFLSGVCILLALAMLGLAWYAYPMLRNHDTSLRNLPSVTQRLNQSVDSIRDRLKEAEKKVADSLSSQRSLREQVGDLGRNLRARIETVSKQASQSADDTYHKLQTQIETEAQAQAERLAKMNERVSGLESSREADQAQVAQLQQELNQVREQADARDAQRDRTGTDAVSDEIAVRKIPFEVAKNHSSDLGEGISLYIDSTNTVYGRVSGWMWVAGDHRNIWLNNQSVQEPVIFYGNADGQKRELVITNVNKNSVTGYLVLPKQAA